MAGRFQSRLGSSADVLQQHISHEPSAPNDYGSIPRVPRSSHFEQAASLTSPTNFFSPQLPIKAASSNGGGKLSTFEGVFVPTVLSIWGILVFIRFGFIIAQAGVVGAVVMLGIGYLMITLTSLSISAISTNGTVRGGGVYYMISRSLGPEFGGAIGLVFYLGQVMGTTLNVLGFVESLQANFGENGSVYPIFPSGQAWDFFYKVILLLISALICICGSKTFARASVLLATLLLISTVSVYLSLLFQTPFNDTQRDIDYTGMRWSTLAGNLWPKFTVSADGKHGEPENFQSVFGVLFPACVGIMAGASMSGDLANPSKSIPSGTLWAVATTYLGYNVIIVLMGATIARTTLYTDFLVLQDIALSPPIIIIGIFSSALFSVLGSLIGAAKILQAIAKDNLLFFLEPFSHGGFKTSDEPTMALIASALLALLLLFNGNINAIASFITMFSLLTFGVTNLACFLLKAASAPNFRPRFRFFKLWTAFLGMLLCIGAMFFVDPVVALLSILFMGVLFGWIHYSSGPKSWGDVTQSLIYHQVRKYLLRLDSRKEHVKFWRPQILLLNFDPEPRNGSLIHFLNALKKGSLYILGHVIRGEFHEQLPELRRLNQFWLKFVDTSRVKAFVQINIAKDERAGARNLVMDSGLGGMKPNIVALELYDLEGYRRSKRWRGDSNLIALEHEGPEAGKERGARADVSITDWCGIIEDVLLLNKAVAIAHGFERLEHPPEKAPLWALHDLLRPTPVPGHKRSIDLWPIQMTSSSASAVVTTNFFSYTFVLQLGTILHMVPKWGANYELRVICFVEREVDVADERARVQSLLDNLRVPARLLVFSLETVRVPAYEAICLGRGESQRVETELGSEQWWLELKSKREAAAKKRPPLKSSTSSQRIARVRSRPTSPSSSPKLSAIGAGLVAPLPGLLTPAIPHSMGMRISMSIFHPANVISEVSDESDTEEEAEEGEEGEEEEEEEWGRSPGDRWEGGVEMSTEREENGESSHLVGLPLHMPTPHLRRVHPNQELVPTLHAPPLPPGPLSESGPAPKKDLTVEFNDLPAVAQNLILNEVMRKYSRETNVLITTLPAPEPGTSDDEEQSKKYVENLEMLVGDLPPVLLIHAKTLTVTMAL
ncbi:uncharacterized protein VTP21DRAFT_2484 [Calcarisporiella thermophila]|uniref:uncharacterized protein n=1 Tax=Calcarisporiella thermophila TaxID=911321 RepID=UPI0037420D91